MPSARMPSPLDGNSCLEHLCPALNQLSGFSYCFLWPYLERTGRRVKRGVGTEDGRSEHISAGPISCQLSPLEVPGAGWAAAAALELSQLAQSGGAAWPLEPGGVTSAAAPQPREPRRLQPPAPALPAGTERRQGRPAGAPGASVPGTVSYWRGVLAAASAGPAPPFGPARPGPPRLGPPRLGRAPRVAIGCGGRGGAGRGPAPVGQQPPSPARRGPASTGGGGGAGRGRQGRQGRAGPPGTPPPPPPPPAG